MSRIVLSGYYGFNNLGDEAVLGATVDALRARCPGVEIAVLSADPRSTAGAYGVEGIPRARPGDLLRSLRRCDLCLSGGGSLFQDVTSWRSPWYYLGVLALAQRFGRRTALYAQGIGPLRGRAVRSATRRVLNGVDLITLRDPASLAALAELGVDRPPVALAADPALLLEPDPSTHVAAEVTRWGGGTPFGLAVRAWDTDAWLATVAAAARTVAERRGARWICVPMHPPGDVAVAARVAEMIGGGATVVEAALRPREMLALFGRLAVVVGMRLHALMFAAIQGVPLVSLAYDPKVAAFAHELGEPVLDPATLEAGALVEVIERAADTLAAGRARLLAAVAPLRARAAIAPQLVARLVS
ncbi:MAG TPA: polysaccharide pyruvyl transferase CsaB [bacterium]|nr:polysaccharide pyruvyl transferase CsaB [bacterium]